MEANSKFFLTEINGRYVDKIASETYNNMLKYMRIPFGLRNVSTTLQNAMNVILTSNEWQNASMFNKIIDIFLKTLEKKLLPIQKDLHLLRHAKVSIKLWNCASSSTKPCTIWDMWLHRESYNSYNDCSNDRRAKIPNVRLKIAATPWTVQCIQKLSSQFFWARQFAEQEPKIETPPGFELVNIDVQLEL